MKLSTAEFASIVKRGLQVTGATYPHRDKLKAMGCVWVSRDKAWFAPDDETLKKAQELVSGVIYNSPPPADLTGDESAEKAADKFGRKAVAGATIKPFSVFGLAKGDDGQPNGSIRRVRGVRYVQIARTKRQYLSRDWLEDMDMFDADAGGSYQWSGVPVESTPDELAADTAAAAKKQAPIDAKAAWDAVVAQIATATTKIPAGPSKPVATWGKPVMVHTGSYPQIYVDESEAYYYVPGYFACDWDYPAVHRIAPLTDELRAEIDAAIAACKACGLLK